MLTTEISSNIKRCLSKAFHVVALVLRFFIISTLSFAVSFSFILFICEPKYGFEVVVHGSVFGCYLAIELYITPVCSVFCLILYLFKIFRYFLSKWWIAIIYGFLFGSFLFLIPVIDTILHDPSIFVIWLIYYIIITCIIMIFVTIMERYKNLAPKMANRIRQVTNYICKHK